MQLQCGACSGLIETPPGWDGQAFPCPRCGAMVASPVPTPPAAEPDQVAPGTKRCPHCGESIQQEAVKCRHCGEWLDASKRAAMKGAEELLPKFQKGMKGLGWGLIVFGVIYLLVSGGFMTMASGPGASGQAAVFAAVFVLLGLASIVCGILLFMRYVWTNYVSLALFSIVGVLGLINIVSIGGGVAVIGLAIPLVAIINSSSNLSQYKKILAAGLDPWQKVEKKK